MQTTHQDRLLKGAVSAQQLCQVSLLVQVAQVLLQLGITFNSAYREFPFYMLLNAVTVLPHAYGFLLFGRYCCTDGPTTRACLPIASLILCVTTSVLVFQLSFMQLKDLGPARRAGEDVHIAVSADYESHAKSGSHSYGGHTSRYSHDTSSKAAAKPLTTQPVPAAGSLIGFLVPFLILAVYWTVVYHAFNGYAQKHLPQHRRQGASSGNQGRPQNQRGGAGNTVIKRIIAERQEKKERTQIQSEVELRDDSSAITSASYQAANQNQEFSSLTESSGDSGDLEGDRRQQDFEDELNNNNIGSVPGESSVANQLRQMRLAAINRQKSQSGQ